MKDETPTVHAGKRRRLSPILSALLATVLTLFGAQYARSATTGLSAVISGGLYASTTSTAGFMSAADKKTVTGLSSSLYFGDGSDGDLTISSGTTTLTQDAYYRDVTITGTGVLSTAGYRVFASRNCVFDNLPAGAIIRNGAAGGAGNAAGSGGTAGGALASASLGGATAGIVGGAGGTAGGTQGGAATGTNPGNGGASGASGAGGDGSGGTGGALRAGTGISNAFTFHRFDVPFLRGIVSVAGGTGGPGGGGGGGDGTSGAGGGGGGSGAAILWVSCANVSVGASTTASSITAIGGAGGNGGSAAAGNRGGGGGGGGAGGGHIFFAYGTLTGTASNIFDASGGKGGDGGTKTGTGTNGAGATGGSGGRISLCNLGSGVCTETTGSAGTAGSGTTGGAGNVLRAGL